MITLAVSKIITTIKRVTYQEAGSKYKRLQKSIEIDYDKQC